MVKLIVIADDLTGALDTAVQFTKKGVSAVVITDMKAFSTELADYQVVVVNTESRHLLPEEAAERVRIAAEFGGSIGAEYYYKKIDSTLRGNVGAELGALLHACDSNELMLVPAFSKMGRSVRGGLLYVDGILLGETGFAYDPLNPVCTSGVADIITAQTDIPVHLIRNPDDLPRSGNSEKIFLFDAESDKDLNNIGEYLAQQDRIHVAAGSAGFAEFLADMPIYERKTIESIQAQLPMLIVCGSLNEVSRRQTRYAESLGYHRISLIPEELVNNGCLEQPAIKQSRDDAVAFLKADEDVILETCSLHRQTTGFQGKGSLNLATQLGHVVKSIIDESGITTLVVFGGDTAIGILNALQMERIEPLYDIVPGVALSEIVSTKYRMYLITKAGGFGDEDLIHRIALYLNN